MPISKNEEPQQHIDELRSNDDNSMVNMNTELTVTATLDNFSKKRSHETEEVEVESTNSPNAKRVKISSNDVTISATNGDFETMDTGDTVDEDSTMQTLDTEALTDVANTLPRDTEDFSSIARSVTEQIVLKVSDCYGGDS
jgi:hypothetical protein